MFLTPNDFTVQNGELVKINDQGYTFVFFFTNQCVWCNDVKPAFNYLSKIIRGINFAYMDVEQNNWQLLSMSQRTRNPIEYVPLLRLFANGRFIAEFKQDEDNPQNNIPKMQNFIIANTRRQQEASQPPEVESNIPPYTIGIPGNLASRKVCKLFNNAYGTK